MTIPVKIGIYLPSYGIDAISDIVPLARHAEDVGLESVWVGDHLVPVSPILDSMLVLTAAAAATERIKLGFGVMILALRPVAWAAKQIATLQHLSGDRVLLGVGSGGGIHGDAGWRAVGVPYRERGQRTDAALEALPGLVTGKPTMVDGEHVTLAPGSTMPPVLIANGPARFRRVVRYGDEWFPAFTPPDAIAPARRALADLAGEHGRPAPGVTIGVSIGLGDLPASQIDGQVHMMMQYGMTEPQARRAMITGNPAQAAERLAELVDAGVGRIVGLPFPADRRRQAELLAESARLLQE